MEAHGHEQPEMPSPEALSEADSGCASLVYELNSRVERLEKENLRLRSSIEEAEGLVDELQSSRTALEADLRQARGKIKRFTFIPWAS